MKGDINKKDMENQDKTPGIFIPTEIWTIKELNLNEKIILSDIYNKTQLKDFKGYAKKSSTLAEETGIKESNIIEALKKLTSKKFIVNNPVRKTKNGKIKTVINYRNIEPNTLKQAERFIIDSDNIFYKKNQKGIFINYQDLWALNSWYISREDERKNYKKLQLENFILFLILKRAMFYDERALLYLARFKKKEITDFTGITRQTIYKIIEILLENKRFNYGDKKLTGSKLYKLSNMPLDIFKNMLNDFIGPDYYENYFTDADLYLINPTLLRKLNLHFGELDNITNLDEY